MALSLQCALGQYTLTLQQFNHIVINAKVRTSWGAKRIVQVPEYVGAVEIRKVIDNFLLRYIIDPANNYNLRQFPNLQYRVDCWTAWSNLERLIQHSETAVQTTRIYKYLVAALEITVCSRYSIRTGKGNDPHRLSLDWTTYSREAHVGRLPVVEKSALFWFASQEFERLWPGVAPLRAIGPLGGEEAITEKRLASIEMVQEALQYHQKIPRTV